LPNNVMLVQACDMINSVANRLSDEIINIDQKLIRSRFYKSWLASNLGERNPYTSDFFLNICQSIAIIESVRLGGHHCVVIDDQDYGQTLLETCRHNQINTVWHGLNLKPSKYRWSKIIKALLSGLKFSVKQISAGRKWQNNGSIKGNGVFLLSWTNSSTFSSEWPKNLDSYFGILPQWIRKFGYKPHWLGNPRSWIDTTSSIVANASAAIDIAIPMPTLIKYRDIGPAIWGWFIFPFAIKKNLIVAGIDVSPVVQFFVRKELSSPQIIQALLLANIAKNMKSKQITPDLIIYTYENQPWEKILLAGFHRFLPNTKMIGVQHAPFAEHYLSAYPSKRQWAEKTAPDILITIGPEFLRHLITRNAPPDRVIVGGSLRMSHLANNAPYQPNTTHNKIKRILVSCPMQTSEATELSVKAIYATLGSKNFELLINFHPSSQPMLIHSVKEVIRNLPNCDHVKFTNEPARSWIKKSDLLIYNSSGTVFDAIREGVPSLYVGPVNGLDLGKLPGKEKVICRTIENIRAAIDQIFEESYTVDKTVEKKFKALKQCFSEPSQSIWPGILSKTYNHRLNR
jgi:hypothetical protein